MEKRKNAQLEYQIRKLTEQNRQLTNENKKLKDSDKVKMMHYDI